MHHSAGGGAADHHHGKTSKLTVNEWLARKARQEKEQKAHAALATQVEEQKKKQGTANGKYANIGFDKWLAMKSKYDKCLELLGQLDTGRCSDVGPWFEAAVAVAATDCALILVHRTYNTGGNLYKQLPRLGQAWVKWTIKHHQFDQVRLTPEKATKFSRGVVENAMDKEFAEEADKGKKDAVPVAYILQSLKYTPKPLPRKNQIVRPLTPDQIRQNKLFISLCHQNLEKAQKEVVKKLLEARGDLKDLDGFDPEMAAKKRMAHEQRVLSQIGIQKMVEWIEEDKETVEKEEARREKENAGLAKAAHDGFVRNKDQMRVRMPPPKGRRVGGSWQPARFDFTRGKGVVRPNKEKISRSSVDMMRGTDQKYIHAIKSKFGDGCDERNRCRNQLLKKGFVHPANFGEEEHDGDFNLEMLERERLENQAMLEKELRLETREKNAEEKFEEWLMLKDLMQRSEGCLKGIQPPERGQPGHKENWIEVGRALKAIDRTLLQAWVDWSAGFKPAGNCRMYWDSFEPIACDVMGGGPIRDLLLRFIGRKGVNYQSAFLAIAMRKFKRAMARGLCEEEDQDAYESEQNKAAYDPPAAYKALNWKEFQELAQSLGIVLQKEEVRLLLLILLLILLL
jgi:hypothetical protein